MAGVTDQDGRSPIWEALGRKFFRMDFLQAERMIEGARDRTVIVASHSPAVMAWAGRVLRLPEGVLEHPAGGGP